MPKISYDVPLVIQAQNPICWIASCAMEESWGTQSSIGIGKYTGGFDPSNSSIMNLAANWAKCTDLMSNWGFKTAKASDLATSGGSVTADDIESFMSNSGPFILLHYCENFPYGPNWNAPQPDANGNKPAHAVVITGIDKANDKIWFNNPWGDKDQSASAAAVLQIVNRDVAVGKTIGSWPNPISTAMPKASTNGSSSSSGSPSASGASTDTPSDSSSQPSDGGTTPTASSDGSAPDTSDSSAATPAVNDGSSSTSEAATADSAASN